VVDFNLYIFWQWEDEIGIPMLERYPSYGEVIRRLELVDAVMTPVAVERLYLCFG
jgi:hypothetical protein